MHGLTRGLRILTTQRFLLMFAMLDLQSYMDAMSSDWMLKRISTGMTLGSLIIRLYELPADMSIQSLINPHSYRGYYSDLAFEFESDKTQVVCEFLLACKNIIGKEFQGYKGGDYLMSYYTPVWIADYGNTGERLMTITDDGKIITAPENNQY